MGERIEPNGNHKWKTYDRHVNPKRKELKHTTKEKPQTPVEK